MAKKSFSARFIAVDPDIGFDGLACVLNKAADAATTVNITDIRAFSSTPYNSDFTNPTGNQGIWSLLKCYSHSDGTLISPMKFDTASSDLPSQVEFRAASSIDYSTGGVVQIRRLGDAPSFGMTQAIPLQGQLRAPGVLDSNDHSGRFSEGCDFWHADGISDTEPLVLREDEGIALATATLGLNRSSTWTVTVRNASSGATYRYRVDNAWNGIVSGDIKSIWSLRNNTGSGVVLQVMIITDPDMGESNWPRFRIAKTYGVKGLGGFESAVTPVAHDTANSLTELQCYAGPFRPELFTQGLTQSYWDYQTTPVPIAEQQKAGTIRHFLQGAGMLSLTGSPNIHAGALGYGMSEHEVWPGERRNSAWEGDNIVLRVGEGIAVIAGGNGLVETSMLANLDIEIQGYVETPAAVFPGVGDVDSGVTYGPTGADYTGTLQQPPEAKVENGYSYGAGGTEFTGTLVGGAGGGTIVSINE